jgi:hypothetical protein
VSRLIVIITCSLYLPSPSLIMENWSRLSSSISSLSIGQSAFKIAKGFNSNVQAARERLGQVSQDELTELPPGNYPAA